MPTLLHVDSSAQGSHSVSRVLTSEFADHWRTANPGGTVIYRDLAATPPTYIDGAWIHANFTPPEARTDAQRAALALSDELVGEMRAAETYVIGAPLYNFTVAATLKAWIDQIVRSGETFRYGATGPVGLLTGKRVTFAVSSGGTYGPDAASLSMNHVEPYLKTMFGFLGITDVAFVTAGGTAALRQPEADRAAFIAPHLVSIRSLVAAA